MGARHIQPAHRRASAAKQRRLTENDEDLLLHSLIARFSPTISYTYDTDIDASPTDLDPVTTPTDVHTTPPPATPTPPPPPPPPPPTTTPIVPNAPLTTQPTNTAVTPTTPVVQPVNTDSAPVQIPQVTTSINVVTTPTISSRPTTSVLVSTRPLTTSATRSIDSSAASSSPTDTGGSGTNVGGVVGGIAGALLGIAVVVFIVQFLMKRHRRKNEDEASAFNASDFRQSAALIHDPPTHDETVARGYNPRPPTMIERRLATPAPTFGAQYGADGPYGATGGTEYGNMDQYGQYQSYGPGETMNNMFSPVSATSAHPMYPNQAYGQSPFSPIGSPVSSTAVLTRQSSSATQLSRHPSAGVANGYPQDTLQFTTFNNQVPVDYVDLDRSSVTPYQAAQYAEISQKLNTEVPVGLDTPAVNAFVQNSNGVKPGDSTSPFADPVPAALLPGGSGNPVTQSRPLSDSVAQELNDFPSPPSPTPSFHARVDSTPPTLPEIHVESRVASYDFPASAHGSGIASGFPSGITKDYMPSPLANQFPATPSPMASSFGIQSPPPAANSFPAAATTPAPPQPGVKATDKRPETVYDDTDAYGGF